MEPLPMPGFDPRQYPGAMRALALLQSSQATQGRPPSAVTSANDHHRFGGVMNALGRVFGGEDDPRLTAEQNKAAHRQGMLNAGLSMMAASGPQAMTPSFGQIVATGAMAGQQAGTNARARAAQQQRSEQLHNLIRQTPADQLPMVAQELIARGYNDEARTIIALLQAQPQSARGPQLSVTRGTDQGQYTMSGNAGEVQRAMSTLPAPTVQQNMITASGREFPNTREGVAAALAWTREHSAAGRGPQTATPLSPQNTLAIASRYEADPIVKESAAMASAVGRLNAAARAPSAAGDLAVIYSYMKILDPTSVVREGEAASAQNAAGVPERIRAQYNKTITGQRLTDATRADFVSRAAMLAKQQRSSLAPVLKRYRKMATDFGVSADNIVSDPFDAVLGAEVSGPRGTAPQDSSAQFGAFDRFVPGKGR